MVTTVTSYKTHDGKLFENEQSAVLHETKLERDKYKANLLYNIVSSTDMIDRDRALSNIHRMFSNKNTRKLIREMLDLYAEPGND